jgi:hypothetical protein
MGWLRKNRDVTALVVAWAILVQSALVAFASAAAAAAAISGDPAVICTAEGPVTAKTLPQPKRHGSHLNCCSLACRTACNSGIAAGVLPEIASLQLPSALDAARLSLAGTTRLHAADISAARPRGPPAA